MIFLRKLLHRLTAYREISMKKDGYITVYLSLTVAVMLSLVVTLIESIRVQTIRFETECVMDMGMTSIFAEYNRELLKQYGLLAIDTSYGSADAGEERTKSHLLQYLNMNFVAPGASRLTNYKDLTAIHADNADLYDVSYLSDGDGEILKYQIIRYMKEKTGLSYAESIISAISYSEKEDEYTRLESKKKSSQKKISRILEELNAGRKEGEEEISIDNPADKIDEIQNSVLLELAVKDSNKILRNKIEADKYISHRGYNTKGGLWDTQSPPEGVANHLLLRQYLFDNCGYYGKIKDESVLGYQIEYLLYGNDNDFDNLDDFAKQLFKVRYVINATYLFGNSAKENEARVLAAAVTTGLGSPQLTEAVKMTILFAWCYAETIQDLRILYDGNAVSEIKSDNTWNIPLSELLAFTATLDSYHTSKEGKTYEDYLAGFVFMKEEKIVLERFMDLLEMDIQSTEGNRYFQIDQCIYQLRANVNVSSKYGYGYSIAREYSYE